MVKSFQIILFTILCQFCVFIYAQYYNKSFRKDYTYFESTRSFYKIHTFHKTWQNARKTCAMEGTSLFYPEDKTEADVVSSFLNTTQPFVWLFVGASDVLAKGVYDTIKGVAVMDTYHNWEPGKPSNGHPQNCVVLTRWGALQDVDCSKEYPFACKKSLPTLEWNKPCNMPYMDYVYDNITRHCYKFHSNPLNWSDAYTTCRAELSYLAIINGLAEADILVNLTAHAPKDQATGIYDKSVYLGFQQFASEDGWITVKGVPLKDSGYFRWQKGKPNNAGGKKNCGNMDYHGELNDVECNRRAFFICEHDVDVPKSYETETRSENGSEFISRWS